MIAERFPLARRVAHVPIHRRDVYAFNCVSEQRENSPLGTWRSYRSNAGDWKNEHVS